MEPMTGWPELTIGKAGIWNREGTQEGVGSNIEISNIGHRVADTQGEHRWGPHYYALCLCAGLRKSYAAY